MEQNKTFEQRAYAFEVRAEQDAERGAMIRGRPIVYQSETDIAGMFSEVIERGALDETDLKDVRFLINHDVSMIPLARSRNNNENSTMQLMPDNDGLGIRVSLDTENNTKAKSLYSAVRRGDITGMSFMFSIPKDGDTWDDIDGPYPKRHIHKIAKVLEVSAVTFPAYENTEISARDAQTLESARAALDSARKQDPPDGESLELALLKAKYLYGI